MKRDGLEFKDALHELGRRAGIEIVEEHRPEAEIEDQHLARLREAIAAAAQWFNHLLLNNPQATIARSLAKAASRPRRSRRSNSVMPLKVGRHCTIIFCRKAFPTRN
jgi:DNA primase